MQSLDPQISYKDAVLQMAYKDLITCIRQRARTSAPAIAAGSHAPLYCYICCISIANKAWTPRVHSPILLYNIVRNYFVSICMYSWPINELLPWCDNYFSRYAPGRVINTITHHHLHEIRTSLLAVLWYLMRCHWVSLDIYHIHYIYIYLYLFSYLL